MNEATKKNDNKPVKIIRQGAIGASIWKRQTPTGMEYYDYSISRSWRAKATGKEGYSPNFFSSNETELTQVIKDASTWIACQHVGTLAGQVASDHDDDEDGDEVYCPVL